MYNLNIFLKKKSIIVIVFNCTRTYTQGYTLVLYWNKDQNEFWNEIENGIY